jgi:hypothetical protein
MSHIVAWRADDKIVRATGGGEVKARYEGFSDYGRRKGRRFCWRLGSCLGAAEAGRGLRRDSLSPSFHSETKVWCGPG